MLNVQGPTWNAGQPQTAPNPGPRAFSSAAHGPHLERTAHMHSRPSDLIRRQQDVLRSHAGRPTRPEKRPRDALDLPPTFTSLPAHQKVPDLVQM